MDDPATLLSRSYDLVLDGNEIGGGSIRNHRIDVQQKVFELIGIGPEDAEARFGFLLDALRYGAPPHGGIAFGIDRIVALLAGRDNIREVIAFPKATSGGDPLTGAPAPGRRHPAARARPPAARLTRPAGGWRLSPRMDDSSSKCNPSRTFHATMPMQRTTRLAVS